MINILSVAMMSLFYVLKLPFTIILDETSYNTHHLYIVNLPLKARYVSAFHHYRFISL